MRILKFLRRCRLWNYEIFFLLLFVLSCDAEYVVPAVLSPVNSVYSWNREIFECECSYIGNFLLSKDIGTVYQGLYPSDFECTELPSIVENYRSLGVELCYLAGDPSWDDASEVIEYALEPLVEYNKRVSSVSRINRVCFDIEFFNAGTEPDVFIGMMGDVYDYCRKEGLYTVLCLPYWLFDDSCFIDILDYTDKLSCSVFLTGMEESLIKNAVDLCAINNTEIECILDMQPESLKYSVSSENTYYHLGFSKALETSEKIGSVYGIGTSFHSLSVIRSIEEY